MEVSQTLAESHYEFDMTPELQIALVEALYMIQAFVAALDAWQITRFFVFTKYKDAHKIATYTVAPLLGFFLFFIILTQWRCVGRNHKLNLDFEWIKSGIVTALWIWMVIEAGVDKWGSDAHMTVACILSIVFIALIFYTTLGMAATKHRGERGGRVVLPD